MKAPIKYPGAKWSMAEWIVAKMPPHKVYLEPFFGSGAVFFNKPAVQYETINDIDDRVVNFFKVCRDRPEDLARAVALTPWSRKEFEAVQEERAGQRIPMTGDPVEDARRFVIRCSQGFGNKTADRVGWKNTKHSAGSSNPRVWSALPDRIILVGERLKNAQIECRPAEELIPAYNAEDCLIYIDAPYPGKTRKGKRLYFNEMMGDDEHEALLNLLLNHKGPVIVSCYRNQLYDDILKSWHVYEKAAQDAAGKKRTEAIWTNYDQIDLFGGW